jgi:hypothetical protein
MNNPISTVLRRQPPHTGKCGASGTLLSSTVTCAEISPSSNNPKFVRKGKSRAGSDEQDEPYEWEGDADWLHEAGDVVKLTLMAPISTIELVGKSMSHSDCSDCGEPASKGQGKPQEEVDWGTGAEWLEEFGHVLKLSLSAPVNCVELLGKSMFDSEEDKITI